MNNQHTRQISNSSTWSRARPLSTDQMSKPAPTPAWFMTRQYFSDNLLQNLSFNQHNVLNELSISVFKLSNSLLVETNWICVSKRTNEWVCVCLCVSIRLLDREQQRKKYELLTYLRLKQSNHTPVRAKEREEERSTHTHTKRTHRQNLLKRSEKVDRGWNDKLLLISFKTFYHICNPKCDSAARRFDCFFHWLQPTGQINNPKRGKKFPLKQNAKEKNR